MYFLGIDAGGSQTTLALADERTILARHSAGTIKLGRVSAEDASRVLDSAVAAICEHAGVAREQIGFCAVGLSGASRPHLREFMEAALKHILPDAPCSVVGDHVIAHRAAFSDGVGVLVIAGTGSIAYARNADGNTSRAGGWGPVVSDEGSGSWIGREAVRRCLRAHDRAEHPALLDALMRAWDAADIVALQDRANAVPTGEFASLFPPVLHTADAGDELARGLLSDAGRELADLALAAASRLSTLQDHLHIALAGGVASSSADVRDAFDRRMRELRRSVDSTLSAADPIEGAIALAREMALRKTGAERAR